MKLAALCFAALLPAAAYATVADEPLTQEEKMPPPRVLLPAAGVPDMPPQDGLWVKVRWFTIPLFVKKGDHLPYPLCIAGGDPMMPCVEGYTHPPAR